MAFTIKYTYLSIDKFTRIGAKIAKAQEKLGRVSNKTANTFVKSNNRINKSMIGLGKSAKGFIGLAAGAMLLKKGADAGMDFQDSMANLSAITGATGKDLEALKQKALSSAKAFGVWQADVGGAMDLVASAKPDLLDNLNLLGKTTDQVLLLANASGMDLADSANAVTLSLNAFSKGAEKAGEVVNVLAAGSKFGSSKIEDTAEAIKIAAGASSAAGINFLQLNAAIQTVSKSGFKASQAGTALGQIFTKLAVNEKINFSKSPLGDVLVDLKTKMEAMEDPVARSTFLFDTFGAEHSKVASGLIKNATLFNSLTGKMKGTNAAAEQAAIRNNTMSFRLKQLAIVINEKIIKVFDKLEPTITKLATKFADWMGSLDNKDIEKFAESIAVLANALGELVLFLGKLSANKDILGNVFKAIPGVGAMNNIYDLAGKATGDNSIFETASNFIFGESKSESKLEIVLSGNTAAVQSTKIQSKGPTNVSLGSNM